jgi:hypothetical protein
MDHNRLYSEIGNRDRAIIAFLDPVAGLDMLLDMAGDPARLGHRCQRGWK